jgi:DNA-binding beta-propeller fold protein YncE
MKGLALIKQGLLLAAICSLAFTACTSEKVSGKEESAQQDKATPAPAFVASHPEKGDMNPDGTIFVSLTPGAPVLNILKIEKEQKQSMLALPRPAVDVVMVNADQALLSFGPTGEVAVADLKKGKVGESVKVGVNTQGLCRAPSNQAMIADADARQLYLFDLATGKVMKSFPVNGNPTQMRWATEGVELEAANAEGKVLGKINLTQPSKPTEAAN